VPANNQVVARRDERRLEILEGCVQLTELKTREARSEETLRFQHLYVPFPVSVFFIRQEPKSALERAERAIVVSHGEAQPSHGRICDDKLPLHGGVLGFLVRSFEQADSAFGALDSELDVSDALADEAKQMKGGRVVRALFEISIEREERREKVVWRRAVAVPGPGAEVVVEFVFGELDVSFRL